MRALAALLLLLASALPAAADESCDPEHPDCSCGKIPVCVISGHVDGLYSGSEFDGSKDRWKGFGEGMESYGAAMQAEMEMLAALSGLVPCMEPVPMDAYQAGIMVAMDEAEQQGLLAQLAEAKTAGDAERIAEINRQIDALLERFGAGGFPWRDPELAAVQLARRTLSCVVGRVELTASADGGTVTMSTQTSGGPGNAVEGNSQASGGSTAEAISKMAPEIAATLNKARDGMFESCRTVLKRTITTDFDLNHQAWESTSTTSCSDGRVVDTQTETGPGIGMGETTKRIQGCCSRIAALRQSQDPEDADDRETLNEIWCEGTWNLRADDLDCDGAPNAADPTPWPPGEGPDDP